MIDNRQRVCEETMCLSYEDEWFVVGNNLKSDLTEESLEEPHMLHM